MKTIKKITVAILILIIFLVADSDKINNNITVETLLLLITFYLSIKFVSHE